MKNKIEDKIKEAFIPEYLEVTNESYMHNVPEGSESHFRILIVSDFFRGKSRIDRHRAVQELIKEELATSIHAVNLKLMSVQEWESKKDLKHKSPDCKG